MHSECDVIRDLAFDYRADELSDVESRRVDDHLDTCASCADHFGRIATLLEAPTQVALEAESRIDPDALFSRITQTLGIEDAGADTLMLGGGSPRTGRMAALSSETTHRFAGDDLLPNTEPSQEVPVQTGAAWLDDTPANLTRSASSAGWWVAAAACLLATFLGFGVLREARPPSPTPNVEETALARAELPDLSAPAPSIELRASADAAWRLSDDGDSPRVLTVDSGAVLVEYIPDDRRDLIVHAADRTFRVVGTVFFVDAQAELTRIGVLTGAVELDGQTLRGGAIDDGGGPRPMTDEEHHEWSGHVDLAMHEVRLQAAAQRAEPSAPDGDVRIEAVEVDPGVTPPPARPERAARPARERSEPAPPDARAEAERAMAERRWNDAAQAYEALIRSGRGGAGVRLDLARLYLRRLDAPAQAVPHLRAFVERNPTDPVAESARRELCRVSAELGVEEALCR